MQSQRAVETNENRKDTNCERFALFLSLFVAILLFPISWLVCIGILKEYERAVIFRLGRVRKGAARGPGIFWILPCIDSFTKVDLRTTSFEVPPQEVLSKDSVSIKLDAVVFYRFFDPLLVVLQVSNVRTSTEMLAQTTLRKVAGTKALIELLADKDAVSKQIEDILDHATYAWGVKVERVEIKNVRLPIDLQRSLAQEAEAKREAKAKIVAADGELLASKALKQASDVMSQNAITLQLRYLQTITFMATEKNSTVILPFPIDLMQIDGDNGNDTCICTSSMNV